MENLNAIVAEDLLSKINPSIKPDRLNNAYYSCTYGSKLAEQTIIKGLELLTKQDKLHYAPKPSHNK